MRTCMGVDRSDGMAGRLAEARATAEKAGSTWIRVESKGIVADLGNQIIVKRLADGQEVHRDGGYAHRFILSGPPPTPADSTP